MSRRPARGLVYLAGPIDHKTEGGQEALADYFVKRLEVMGSLVEAGYAIFDPSKPYTEAMNDPIGVYRANEAVIASCDVVVALLPTGIPTVGTPTEIASAKQAGKPVVVMGGQRSMQLLGMGIQPVEWGAHKTVVKKVAAATAMVPINRMLQGKYRKLHEADLLKNATAPLKWTGDPECAPQRHYPGDAGYDLVVAEDRVIKYEEQVDVPLGISVQLPPGFWAMLTGRSSTLRRRGLLVTQGVIDNGYRGDLFAGVRNMSHTQVTVKRGERIAQLIPFALDAAMLVSEQVERLEPSDRGDNGFGSTGA